MGDTVNMVKGGEVYAVPADQVQELLNRNIGFQVQSAAQQAEAVTEGVRQDTYGGVSGKIAAGAAALARGATGGLSDVAGAALGIGDDLAALRDVNPTISTVGEIGGAVGGAFLPGSVVGRVAKIGSRISEGGGIVRAGLGAGVEGGLLGLGQGASELALSDDPLTAERVGSVLSSNMLFGGAIGAGTGIAAKVLEKGLVRSKAALDEGIEAAAAAPKVADDLASMDAAGLRAAREAELEQLAANQVTAKAATVDDITRYRATVKEANPWLVIDAGENAAQLNKSTRSLRGLMDDPQGLAKNPTQALKALRIQEQALTKSIGEADEIAAKLAAQNKRLAKDLALELETLPDDAAEVVLSGRAARRYASAADVKVAGKGEAATVRISREDAGKFLENLATGAVGGQADQALKRLPELVDANRALQAKIESASLPKIELTSDRLKAIDAARDALSTGGRPKGMLEQLASGSVFGAAASAAAAIPVIGPAIAPFAGMKAAQFVGEKVFGRMAKAGADGAARMSSAIGKFVDAAQRAAPVAPVLATQVLSSVRYAASHDDDSKPTLASSYKARADEIRSQVGIAPDGSLIMRPEVRQQVADRLAPVRAGNPMLADKMETIAARRFEFLANKLPRRPDLGGMQSGPDRWQPSDMEMRQFARYAAAVEDPHGVVERLAGGTVTPEDAEAMRAVYPEMMQDIIQQIVADLPKLKAGLPYQKRLALSVFAGVPVDDAMNPAILATLQASYDNEEGSEGGSQAPRARPAFGSVKSQDATPAQERQGVTT